MVPNLLAFPIAFLGIIRAGAIQANVNPLYTPRELEHQLNDAGAETIVVFGGVSATVAEVLPRTGLKNVITVGVGDGSPAVLPTPPVDPRLTGAIAFADALRRGQSLPFSPVDVGGDDIIFLQYTGGTTGVSKGAALSHRNLVANTLQFAAFMPDAMSPVQEVIVTAIPLYHIFALMVNFITYFSVGADNWLVPNPRDFDAFLDTLKKARPTIFMGVNTLYAGLVAHPRSKEVDWSNLRLAGGGGAAVIGAVSDKWKALTGTFIREGYGLSETSPVLSFNPAAVQAFTGTTGLPVPSTDIKLLDEEGREVGIGETGEICAKGPQVMQGYWRNPGERRGVHRRRLLPDRRHRQLRRRRLPAHRRSQEGHGHRLGLQRLPERDRGSGHRLPGCHGMRLHRCRRREDRRGRQALRRPRRRLDADRGRADRALPQGAHGLQYSAHRQLRRIAAEVGRRQDPAARIAHRGLNVSHRRHRMQQPYKPPADAVEIERMERIFETQRQACLVNPPPDIAQRKAKLRAVIDCLRRHQDDIVAAVNADFGVRAPAETKLVEVMGPILEASHALSHLRRWMKPQPPPYRTAVPDQQRRVQLPAQGRGRRDHHRGISRSTSRSGR